MPWAQSIRLTFVLVGISSFRLTLPGIFILSLLITFFCAWFYSRTTGIRVRESGIGKAAFAKGKKRRLSEESRPESICCRMYYLAAGTARGRAAGTAGTSAAHHGQVGFYHESGEAKINGDGLGVIVKILFDHERELVAHVENLIVITLLIQSKRKPRAASAARGEEYADRGFFLVLEIFHQFGSSFIRKFQHQYLRYDLFQTN
jgi:hypothetical protein